jgi:hypothetical protein
VAELDLLAAIGILESTIEHSYLFCCASCLVTQPFNFTRAGCSWNSVAQPHSLQVHRKP